MNFYILYHDIGCSLPQRVTLFFLVPVYWQGRVSVVDAAIVFHALEADLDNPCPRSTTGGPSGGAIGPQGGDSSTGHHHGWPHCNRQT